MDQKLYNIVREFFTHKIMKISHQRQQLIKNASKTPLHSHIKIHSYCFLHFNLQFRRQNDLRPHLLRLESSHCSIRTYVLKFYNCTSMCYFLVVLGEQSAVCNKENIFFMDPVQYWWGAWQSLDRLGLENFKKVYTK